MNTKRVQTAADVVLAALTQNRTAAGIALALESAGMLAMQSAPDDVLAKVRNQAWQELRRDTGTSRPMWRTVITDSESPTGLAPVCTGERSDALHMIDDYPGGPQRDEDGVYDCCPYPQIETYSAVWAEYLAGLLNADASDELTGAYLARWEEEQDNARLRLAWQSARERAQAYGEGILRIVADRESYQDWLKQEQAVTERLRARVAELEAAAEKIRHLHKDSPMGPCPVCVDADAMARGDDYTVPYPCPTARLAGAQDCDPCHPCGCPKRFNRHADGCPTLPDAPDADE
ncbi:hypothetical protein ACIOKD_14440 [Streptomyces sp. NPDC087844]|uniref:hypothetical protein n=1 Tax=Streptomyces sp. NPDC087844 TaxID=3365805 RepID=UPI00380108F2